MPQGATATDLVLTITEVLRRHGVVGKFVEFFGEGTASLSVPDRATIGNMAPEYGATMGFFPVDAQTLDYLRLTGRGADHAALVRRADRRQGPPRPRDRPAGAAAAGLGVPRSSPRIFTCWRLIAR